MNTSEHTKTTIDGGRNGGQDHSLTKRIGGETKIRAAMLRLDAAFKAHLGSTMSELGSRRVAQLVLELQALSRHGVSRHVGSWDPVG